MFVIQNIKSGIGNLLFKFLVFFLFLLVIATTFTLHVCIISVL